MIMYDFECSTCGKIFEELVPGGVKCTPCECGNTALMVFATPPQVEIFKPFTTDHVTGKPQRFETKSQFVEELNKRNLVSHGVYNSFNASNPKKWV